MSQANDEAESEAIKAKLDSLFKEQDEKWERYQALLPDTDDLILVVLKGHLIIEEMLNDLINRLCPNPQHIESAKLNFVQLTYVAQSMLLLPVMDGAWAAIKVLNTLRNKLSHHLEPKDMEKYIVELERLCTTDEKLPAHYKPPTSDAGRAKASICFIIGQLSVCIPISDFIEQRRKFS